MIASIKKTLLRLSGNIFSFDPVNWYPKLLEGLSIEFSRVRDFKNQILNSTVPNDNMYVESIDDYNIKYGIPSTVGGTNQQKIQRIIEKASLTGMPGKDWLQEQIQKAGFELYVIENEVLESSVRRLNTFQLSISNQLGLTARFTDPDLIPGNLIVCSPPSSIGKLILPRLGTFQLGQLQIGTTDPNALNPQPFKYVRTDDPKYWGFYFTLSPFPDRVATLESEFLSMSKNEYEYLKQIIIELKLLRNWCILQAKY